jgi:hypothetical protein
VLSGIVILLLGWSVPASAQVQIKTASLFANGPIYLGSNVELRLTQFGQYVLVDAAATSTLKMPRAFLRL